MENHYNPKDVSLVVGAFTIVEFAEDNHIKVEPITKDKFTSQAGVNGETNWSENNDPRHKITIVLMQQSASNLKLELLSKSSIRFGVLLKNISDGAYVGGGSDCRITERTVREFGKDQKNRTWVIGVNDYSGVETK